MVSIEVDAPDAAAERAFEWFRAVEAHCSRFDAASELRQLTAGKRTRASPILFEAVRFALLVAEETGGAFDPTVGARMAARGFNRNYLTREVTEAPESDDGVSFRDVEIDAQDRSILLRRPLTLDLGAVAKGLAVDAAARELQPFRNFAIDAGGDLYLSGCNPQGKPWAAGIRHPRIPGHLVDSFRISGPGRLHVEATMNCVTAYARSAQRRGGGWDCERDRRRAQRDARRCVRDGRLRSGSKGKHPAADAHGRGGSDCHCRSGTIAHAGAVPCID